MLYERKYTLESYVICCTNIDERVYWLFCVLVEKLPVVIPYTFVVTSIYVCVPGSLSWYFTILSTFILELESSTHVSCSYCSISLIKGLSSNELLHSGSWPSVNLQLIRSLKDSYNLPSIKSSPQAGIRPLVIFKYNMSRYADVFAGKQRHVWYW